MMTMDQPCSGFGDFGNYSSSDPFTTNQSTSSPINTDPDVDWSVFENAERYLLRDDSAWITRLSKDFWWNLERISEMITSDYIPNVQQINNNGTFNRSSLPTQKFPQQQQQQQFMQSTIPTKTYSQQQQQQVPSPMQFTGVPPRKIVGQRTQQQQQQILTNNNSYRNNSMFNNGFTSPPPSSSSSSSSGSTIVRPPTTTTNNNHMMNSNINIPDKSNFFQAFSSMSIASNGGNHDQDMEYNPFQSKISFDNNMWGNNSQQPIPWQ
ncbi:unnamed protein product [Rotaria sp. Silwood1]|nr:unnamed protein product [Rotaria sp. Silwood1]